MIKIKLDENLGNRGKELFIKHDFIVDTVHDEGLCSVSDHILITKCKTEERILISLDLDFANPLVFKPSEYHVVRYNTDGSLDSFFDSDGMM